MRDFIHTMGRGGPTEQESNVQRAQTFLARLRTLACGAELLGVVTVAYLSAYVCDGSRGATMNAPVVANNTVRRVIRMMMDKLTNENPPSTQFPSINMSTSCVSIVCPLVAPNGTFRAAARFCSARALH